MSSDTVIAVDAGATWITSGSVTADGGVPHSHRHPTGAERGPEAVLETILQAATGMVDACRTSGVTPRAAGVALPGVVDEENGTAVWSGPLGLRDVPVRDWLAARLSLPVIVGHSARAAGTAEARLGAGRQARHQLYASVGASVTIAHLINGYALSGAHGAAGELGHMVVRRNGPPCLCGARGCLESVASAAGLRRRLAELGGGDLSPEQIAAAVAAGSELAERAWQEAVDAIADALITVHTVTDVELIVVGGGLTAAGETFLGPLRGAVKERLTFHRQPQVVPSALGHQAGCVGIGLLALAAVQA